MNNRITMVMNTLTPNQRETLNYAHEHNICQFVEYRPGLFIGVDAIYNGRLKIEEECGRWSLGSIVPRSGPTRTNEASNDEGIGTSA